MSDVALIHYKIPDDLHRRAKSAAALEGVSLKAFLEAALEAATSKSTKARKAK